VIVLRIRKAVKFLPKKWEHKDFSALAVGQGVSRFIGDHPSNPEYGRVTVDVDLVQGNFENISELLIIDLDPEPGTLLGFKKKLFGGYRIEVEFDTVFAHGLEYMTQHMFQPNHGILGLTESDKMNIKSIPGQKDLLYNLSSLIIPSRSKEISNLAIPSLRLLPTQTVPNTVSYFVSQGVEGKAKNKITSGNHTLTHIATLHSSEFPPSLNFPGSLESLYFYLNINSIEDGRYPEKPGDFKISTSALSSDPEPEDKIYFDSSLALDIPRPDHSKLMVLDLNDDEQEQYEALESLYKTILNQDHESEEFTKFLGYPDQIQGCVAYEAERVKNNRDHGTDLVEDGARWSLLLQIMPFNTQFEFLREFIDSTLYFMIREDDLLNGNLDDIQVIGQNT
jgi:hypothetical protein